MFSRAFDRLLSAAHELPREVAVVRRALAHRPEVAEALAKLEAALAEAKAVLAVECGGRARPAPHSAIPLPVVCVTGEEKGR